jgi:hypothetical protein
MATSTFEKEIIIDNEAAERLIAALRRSPHTLTNNVELEAFEKHSEEAWQCFLESSRQ